MVHLTATPLDSLSRDLEHFGAMELSFEAIDLLGLDQVGALSTQIHSERNGFPMFSRFPNCAQPKSNRMKEIQLAATTEWRQLASTCFAEMMHVLASVQQRGIIVAVFPEHAKSNDNTSIRFEEQSPMNLPTCGHGKIRMPP